MGQEFCAKANQKGQFILPDLPYSKNALEPHLTENLLNFHHGKHHNTYVVNLNNLINDSIKDKSLEEIVIQSSQDSSMGAIFNNAAQIWNHSFFWHCMRVNGGGAPTGKIADKISQDFGSYDNFRNEFSDKALKVFGSGWCWLVVNKEGKLEIVQTSNAGVPFVSGHKPLLTIDVWEHAYYLDYQNRRADFIKIFFESLVNWDFVNEQLN